MTKKNNPQLAVINSIKNKVTNISSFAEIWESPSGEKSLYSTITFQPGEIISRFESKTRLTEPNYLTLQLDEHEHIMLEPEFLQYINHSCQPNVFFDTQKYVVTCLKKIEAGEEITFFYPSTEWSMASSFNCYCTSQECLGIIQGAAHLQPNILNKYKISDYIKQQLYQSFNV